MINKVDRTKDAFKEYLGCCLLILNLFFFSNGFSQVSEIKSLQPSNNLVSVNQSIIFEWEDLSADSYALQISSDSLFSAPNELACFSSDTAISVALGKYYWRVRATLNSVQTDWSNVRSFTIVDMDSLGGLTLWLKADTGIVYSNNKISQWNDMSGNGYNLMQLDSSEQPILDTISLGGLPSVYFDGNSFMDNLTSVDISTMFTVFYYQNNNSPIITGLEAPNANPRYALYINSNTIVADGNTPFKPSLNYVNGVLSQQGNLDNWHLLSQGRTNTIAKTFISYALSPDYSPANKFEGYLSENIIFSSQMDDSTRVLVEQYLRFKYSPPVNLGPNIYIDYGFCDTTLVADTVFSSFLWSNADTTNSISVNKGKHYVTVTDLFGYESSDTVLVNYPELLDNYVADTTICLGDSLLFYSNLNKVGYSFLWSDNSSDSVLVVTEPGDYYVQITDSSGCFQFSDTITVLVDSFAVQTTLGSDKTVCEGENLMLESVNGAISYTWSTGDTSFQTVVDTAGVYWVQTVNTLGCLAQDTINIGLSGLAPIVGFTNQNECNNELTIFADTSSTNDASSIVQWNWDFGNGDTSAVQNPQYQYSTSGTYAVELSVTTDSGCVNVTQQMITIHDKPDANFFQNSGLICSEQVTNFSDNSFSSDGTITGWNWVFGDAGIADTSSAENPTYTYMNSGSFNVSLIVSTEFGCADTMLQFVSVKQKPTAAFTYSGECVGQATQFSNNSLGTVANSLWDFGDLNNTSQNSPSHVYTVDSVYNVELIVEDINGCIDTVVEMVTINPAPVANFSSVDFCAGVSEQIFDSSTTSSGLITNWNWKIDPLNMQSIAQHPSFVFNESDTGSYNVDLVITTDFGCVDSVSNQIMIRPTPQPGFTFTPSIGLPPLDVNFTNTSIGGDSFHWNFGDGQSSDSSSLVYTYVDSNVFTITLIATSIYGCTDSVSDQIEVIEPILDVAVTNIYYETIAASNYLKVSVELANYGLVEVQNVDLELYSSSSNNILENWQGNLLPNTQQVVQLTSLIELPNGVLPDLLCVKAIGPNGGDDYNLNNNEYCKSLNKFDVVSMYPNPTQGEVFMEYILPTSGIVSFELFNDIGKKIKDLSITNSKKGVNRYEFDFGYLANGIYYLSIQFGDETIRKKIMIR